MNKFRFYARRWRTATLSGCLLLLLISMTGCSRRYVVVGGDETMTLKKSTVDQLYGDNERLLQALEECRSGL